jgi:hypothetical protein
LVNSVLPLWAGLRGEICLHASAVSRQGRATVFAGPSGSGKSMRAMDAINRGALLLADDAVVLRRNGRGWLAYPGSRSLRLQASPAEPSWESGLKREAFVPSEKDAVIVDEVLLLTMAAPGPTVASGSASLFRSLLSVQAGWVWGDFSTRRWLAERTQLLCDDLVGDVRCSDRHQEGPVALRSQEAAGPIPHAAQRLQDGRLV